MEPESCGELKSYKYLRFGNYFSNSMHFSRAEMIIYLKNIILINYFCYCELSVSELENLPNFAHNKSKHFVTR